VSRGILVVRDVFDLDAGDPCPLGTNSKTEVEGALSITSGENVDATQRTCKPSAHQPAEKPSELSGE
jgi:hypothetical protein